MKCPYLSTASRKECVKMLGQKPDEELSDFDMKHFCNGNPVYCYYFRQPTLQAVAPPAENKVMPMIEHVERLLKDALKDTALKIGGRQTDVEPQSLE